MAAGHGFLSAEEERAPRGRGLAQARTANMWTVRLWSRVRRPQSQALLLSVLSRPPTGRWWGDWYLSHSCLSRALSPLP